MSLVEQFAMKVEAVNPNRDLTKEEAADVQKLKNKFTTKVEAALPNKPLKKEEAADVRKLKNKKFTAAASKHAPHAAQRNDAPNVHGTSQPVKTSRPNSSSGSSVHSEPDQTAYEQEITELKLLVDSLEKEIRFYIHKLRDIEVLCKFPEILCQFPEINMVVAVKKILYAADNGLYAADNGPVYVKARGSKLSVDSLKKNRDLYLDMLRDIEIICHRFPKIENLPLQEAIMKILYAADNDPMKVEAGNPNRDLTKEAADVHYPNLKNPRAIAAIRCNLKKKLEEAADDVQKQKNKEKVVSSGVRYRAEIRGFDTGDDKVEEALRDRFKECGEIVGILVNSVDGFALIDFSRPSSLTRACQLDTCRVGGRVVRVWRRGSNGPTTKFRVDVSYAGFHETDLEALEALRKHFEPCGEILGMQIGPNCVWIDFTNLDCLNKALDFDNTAFENHCITVKRNIPPGLWRIGGANCSCCREK